MTDWTKLDMERLADALADIYVSRGFYYEFGEKAREWAGMTAREDARELLDLVADKLDVERLARAVESVYPNPYSATMAAQIAGEYALDFTKAERGVFLERVQRGITTFEVADDDGWREGQPEFNGAFG